MLFLGLRLLVLGLLLLKGFELLHLALKLRLLGLGFTHLLLQFVDLLDTIFGLKHTSRDHLIGYGIVDKLIWRASSTLR